MIGLDFLKELLDLAIYSGYVKYEKPVSVLIVASPESGKTEMLKKYSKNKGVLTMTDVSAYGIRRDIIPAVKDGQIKHIIIPDLLKPLNRNWGAVSDFITLMNSLIEEGVGNISTFYESMKKIETCLYPCGVLTSITNAEIMDRRRKWAKIGFLSRVIPVSYLYSKEVTERVLGSIRTQDYVDEQKQKHVDIILDLPNKEVEIELDEKFAGYIIDKTTVISQLQGLYGFRMARQFNTLLKASALKRGSNIVEQQDVDLVERLLYWINLDLNPVSA